jgi:kinesin family protein 5
MKSEIKNLVQRCQNYEEFQKDSNKKVNFLQNYVHVPCSIQYREYFSNIKSFVALQISDNERDLGECRLLISQHEARMKSLQESMREADNKKRQLEEDVDALREECAKLKAAGMVHSF